MSFAAGSDPRGAAGRPAQAGAALPAGWRVKLADEPWEFEAIHRLNYATFVEEIPQHAPNEHRRLIDRFNHENTYVVAVRDRELLGMMAIRTTRPFSLDTKVPDLDRWLPPGRRCCELRLLAVDPSRRATPLLRALFAFVWNHCLGEGFEAAVISGTVRQLALYAHLGFEPFGPRVGTPEAEYQPMLITRERAERHAGHLLARVPPTPRR